MSAAWSNRMLKSVNGATILFTLRHKDFFAQALPSKPVQAKLKRARDYKGISLFNQTVSVIG
jgi:hypothetical protein